MGYSLMFAFIGFGKILHYNKRKEIQDTSWHVGLPSVPIRKEDRQQIIDELDAAINARRY